VGKPLKPLLKRWFRELSPFKGSTPETKRGKGLELLEMSIDLGIKTFAVMSDGTTAQSPSYKHLYRQIRRLQRKLARQPKDSKRRNKTRLQIAKLHNQIADTRKDFLHKLSTKIVNDNQVIV
ncbi:transposase, partial [Microcoleus anatoxicus]